MKNLWLHGIYLSVIGVLGFQLWAKTVAMRLALEPVSEVLECNNSFFDSHSEDHFNDIEKQVETDPRRYKSYFDAAKQTREASKLASNFIDKMSIKAENYVNLKMLRDSLNDYSKSLTNIQDQKDSFILIKQFGLIKMIQNDTFWKYFDVNLKMNLQLIKNQIKIDGLVYHNYINDKVNRRYTTGCNDCFRVAIAPKKAAIIEGEKFEADIYLAKYTNSVVGTEITFKVDNQNLPFNEDVAHYSKIENKKGLKKLKAVVSFRNILTGAIMTRNGEYEYHVLPKCSQNCQ